MYNFLQLGQYSIVHNAFKRSFKYMRCPNCNGKDIGKIGMDQFYCWNCCVEMTVSGNAMTIQQVKKDGSLQSMNDLFTEQERKIQ